MAATNVVEFKSAIDEPTGKSIQQELLGPDPTTWHMDQDLVEDYVAGQTPEVLQCRERGRHWWPVLDDDAELEFTEWDDEAGLFVRRLKCQCCGLAYRRELWEGKEKTRRGRKRIEWIPVSASVYYKPGPRGEVYAGPVGEGTMTSKQVKQARASIKGTTMGKSLGVVRKEVLQRQKNLGRDRDRQLTVS